MPIDPELQTLIDRIAEARATRTPLAIRGGGTKAFYGEAIRGEALDMRALRGISSYEPSELVITARAGTPLAEVEAALAERGQCLPFDPPRFSVDGEQGGTLGGMVAAGLSGPTRAAVGSVRDHVLGTRVINGQGELMTFGGQVIKNVAGYDVSRLMVGAMGVLGVICEVSLKVLASPHAQATLRFEMAQDAALSSLNSWAGQPLPIHASAWWEGMLVVRLAGASAAVQGAIARLGGDLIEPDMADPFWSGVRDQSDEFFVGARRAVQAGASLWRLSLPSTAAPVGLSGELLIEWGGAQRWLCTTTAATSVREAAQKAGGHATLFMSQDKSPGVFAPLAPPLERIHRELKRAFDPEGIFNPGRLYPSL